MWSLGCATPDPPAQTAWQAPSVSADSPSARSLTEDYLTKKVRKNHGEVKQYLVEHSHDPIIDPDIFDRVQALLAKQRPYRSKLRDSSPFCNKLICADCGGFYGHKVWHNHNSTERYNVWYCNQRYKGGKTCKTPVLRESEIRQAFEQILKTRGEKPEFSEKRWRELIETASVQIDKTLVVTLNDGTEYTIAL